MRRVDLIVSIGADHQQVRQIFLDQQILQKIERRRVQPLQIVEKQTPADAQGVRKRRGIVEMQGASEFSPLEAVEGRQAAVLL